MGIILIFHWQEKKNLKTKKINPMPKNQRRRVTNLEKKKTKKINPMPKNQRRRVTNSEKKKTKKINPMPKNQMVLSKGEKRIVLACFLHEQLCRKRAMEMATPRAWMRNNALPAAGLSPHGAKERLQRHHKKTRHAAPHLTSSSSSPLAACRTS